MPRRLCLVVALLVGLALPAAAQPEEQPIAIVLHGGAGTITPEGLSAEREAAYRATLEEALDVGYGILEEGGSSTDAVVATIQVLEASPLFNAGVGAVLTNQGRAELDASIMRGEDLQAGAVAGAQRTQSPIAAARLVMERSPHVLLAREGADTFAEEEGLPMVENDYFVTDRRRAQLESIQAREREPEGEAAEAWDPAEEPIKKHGTVGVVALDREGHLAAGTSTGGMMNKRWGRVGDSPIIGAGTYADDGAGVGCGVSATGHGEYFIRGVLAYDVCAAMRYGGFSVYQAAAAAIHGKLSAMGATGGLIALDGEGRVAMPFNTAGMFRAFVSGDGERGVLLYSDAVERRAR